MTDTTPSSAEFDAWFIASKQDVEGDWHEFVDSIGDVELYEETGCTRAEAEHLHTDNACEAFREFAYQSFQDSL